ncbi:MAG TPA: AmmeMemoRadiSam system protein B [Methylomirabilota bacterium]|nr:AmmeMemoRadiSam system protein B [Methylomirabilota bacterium]
MEYPRLRYIQASPVDMDGGSRVLISDPLHFAKGPLVMPAVTYFIISHFDGQHSIVDIQEAFAKRFGQILSRDKIEDLIAQLDQYHYLDSERFRREVLEAFYQSPVREMAHADTCYSSKPEEFTRQAMELFSQSGGPGLPSPHGQQHPPLRGIIAPHIDLRFGGPCYAWAYKELAERCDADLFILLGTSHYSMNPAHLFIATEKDYNTPLGLAKTDRNFLRALQQRYNGDLFAEEILHRVEHSLEFQALFLQYVFGGAREFSIVPILVSSFHHAVLSQTPPVEDERIGSFITALKETIAQTGRKACFVAGVDFAHVGRQFGDKGPLTRETIEWVEAEDRRLVQSLEHVDHADFFAQIAKDGDQRRVCGFAPMYTFLHVIEANAGKLLKYGCATDMYPESLVSFASLAFY